MVVLGRKNAFFYKTSAGAAVADTIMSVGVTAQINGINVFDYFNDLQRYKAEVKKNLENWLPWTYRETLKGLKGSAA
jgi:transposase